MRVEKNLTWTQRKDSDVVQHDGLLITHEADLSLFAALAEVVSALNAGDMNVVFPERYLMLDESIINAQGLDKTLGYVVFKNTGDPCSFVLVYSVESPFEYIFSKGRTLAAGDSVHQACSMFEVDDSKIKEFMSGQITFYKDTWYVTDIFDAEGNGLKMYKDELRSLDCPVV